MPTKSTEVKSFSNFSLQNIENGKKKPRKSIEKAQTVIPPPEETGSDITTNEEIIPTTSKRIPTSYVTEQRFDLLIDGVPYRVHTIPFLWNENVCYRVHVNGSQAHVFSWDDETGSLRAIDDAASILPVSFEEAMNNKLSQ